MLRSAVRLVLTALAIGTLPVADANAADRLGTVDRADFDLSLAANSWRPTAAMHLGTAEPASITSESRLDRMSRQAWAAKYEFAALFAGITAIGIINWNWGSSEFHFKSEGWFNEKATGSGGMDKLGHAFSTYVMTELMGNAIRRNGADDGSGQVTAALMAMALMTYVEIFDGYSGDHGFSYEDMIMDAAGAGLSVLRAMVPGMKEIVDFRMQYLPSRYSSFRPFIDYEGQRYVAALKLAGIGSLRETPLRYLELHAGYYARGYGHEERLHHEPLRQRLYVGIGLNVSELLFGQPKPSDHWLVDVARSSLEYVQLPYTYVSTAGDSGR